jgi:uncharacterized protein YeaO (DUF488 family)
VYDEAKEDNGFRVLVDRLWSRGVTKKKAALDEWCKDVAPSTRLRQWYAHDPVKFNEFGRRYGVELKQVKRGRALRHLRDIAANHRLTLLTGTKDPEISEAAVLTRILNRRTGTDQLRRTVEVKRSGECGSNELRPFRLRYERKDVLPRRRE